MAGITRAQRLSLDCTLASAVGIIDLVMSEREAELTPILKERYEAAKVVFTKLAPTNVNLSSKSEVAVTVSRQELEDRARCYLAN